jgi:formamidopyrimidine-DNA glycosylase
MVPTFEISPPALSRRIHTMPELAEVEYFRKQWNPGLGGKVERVLTHPKARIFRDIPAAAVRRGLQGRTLERSFTHGKQMMFEFSDGAWLGLHLGMTGKLFTVDAGYEPVKSDHLVLVSGKRQLVFSDYRMFGKLTLDISEDRSSPEWWASLPPRTLDRGFTKKYHAVFVRRFPKTPIKTLLLDQRGFPGIGNWMADEICWRLQIPPHTPSGELSDEQVDAMWKMTRQVSRDAIRVIADDWSKPPNSWLFNHRWRDGGTCPRRGCRADLQRADLRGRTTCWCPMCQG